jgi:hypothetical protein
MAQQEVEITVTIKFDGEVEDAKRAGIDFAEQFIMRRTKNWDANFGDLMPVISYKEPVVVSLDKEPEAE